jgi:hypothetical protein
MKRPSADSRTTFSGQAVLLLVAALAFRLWFGLFSDSWYQIQIFILGLKYYSTGAWPYFGPSVDLGIQLPGALQAVLVAWPWDLWPAPEAPILLLGLLSFGGICLLAWYISKRLPQFPRLLLWGWLLTSPWTLDWSTQLDNDSYMLFGGCLFFVGFLETVPALRLGVVPAGACNFMMGFAFFWCAQLHMSFVLLGPFLAVSFFFQYKEGGWTGLLKSLGLGFLGSLLPLSLLIPTYLHYGLLAGSGNIHHSARLNPENLLSFFTLLARFLSLACCEVARYAGAHTVDRVAFLKAYPWAIPFTLVAFLLGIIQALWLLAGWARGSLPAALKKILPGLAKPHPQKDWKAVKRLALLTFLLVYASFLFSIKPPASHTFYVTLPVVMLYGFYVYAPYAKEKWFKVLAWVLLISNLVFHTALALSNYQTRSIYKDRPLMIQAIQTQNYHLLGERREDTIY